MQTIEQCYCTDYGMFDKESMMNIDINTSEIENYTFLAHKCFKHPDIRSVNFDTDCFEMDDVDVMYISFYRHGGVYLTLQNKWDASDTAEYEIA